jgi:hypothetical protein
VFEILTPDPTKRLVSEGRARSLRRARRDSALQHEPVPRRARPTLRPTTSETSSRWRATPLRAPGTRTSCRASRPGSPAA